MTLKIKVKRINPELPLPTIIKKGEWIDLRSSKTHNLKQGEIRRLELGVAMKLPEGFEAPIISRSSTPDKYGIVLLNCYGMIDNSYSGNNDEWKYESYALRDTMILSGDRICQFRIQLSQKATLWQKLKWLLSSKIEIVEVDNLEGPNRGGFGSTN